MEAGLQPLLHTYATNQSLMRRCVEGLGREDLVRIAAPGVNPMIWLAGHLTYCRCYVGSVLGLKESMSCGPELFGKGAKPLETRDWPAIEEILQEWDRISAVLMAAIQNLPASQFEAPAPIKLPPICLPTVRGGITGLSFHESYHIGQMAQIRKMLGHGSLFG